MRANASAIWLRFEFSTQTKRRRLIRRSDVDSVIVLSLVSECGITTAGASFRRKGINHQKRIVAAAAPRSWATIKPGTSLGLMPAKVSLIERASVTAGLANDVDDV